MSTSPSSARRRRRAALAAVLALVGLPLVVTSSAEAADCATGMSCVEITYVSTKNGVIDEVAGPFTYQINDHVDLVEAPRRYDVRSTPGAKPQPVDEKQPLGIPNTLPLSRLLAQAESDKTIQNPVTFSETPGARGIPAVLSPERLNGTSKYKGGLEPAVYAKSGGRVGYVRPLGGSKYDVNAAEVFTTKGPLKLTFHITGDLVTPTITPSPKKPTTAGPVSFSAKIAPDSDEKFGYEWNFRGTSSVQSTKATPTYPYKKKGSYAVNLTVRGDDGSYGRASTTTIKVGTPPKPKPTPTTGTGGTGGGTGTGTGGGSGYVPRYVPSSPTVPSDDAPVEEPPTEEFPTAPVDDGLEEVEGFVLVGAGAELGESIPGTEAPAQPTEANELSTTRKISGAVIGTLAVLLLLGLGAEIETRWLSTRLGHLRRRA